MSKLERQNQIINGKILVVIFLPWNAQAASSLDDTKTQLG